MNYRMLFIISLLTLVVGVGGILFMPTGDSSSVGEGGVALSETEKKPEKLITLAELKRDIQAGNLLQVEDYSLTEIKVTEDNPLINNDLTDVLALSKFKTLQGHLISENLKSGSLLSPSVVISPNDSRFLMSSLDTKQEIAFRIYLKPTERYILDTLRSGDYVSVYNQKIAYRAREESIDKNSLIKIINKLLVLQVYVFQVLDENNDSAKKEDELAGEYIGYISLKVNANQAKMFYELEKDSKLIVLPSVDEAESSNNRGVFIRKLRGNKS
ncbi:TPA: flp operon protein C [Pasteurella multocida]|uniref:SAF domain-containing protein n=2 Tax=Pasteurella multocida TaxID=747 RepID=UPI000233F6E3|nr:SAF domain-containing protein [Pasteurella multocida]AWW59785.1 flp operon protein C [Pasteurellaceae bacterium 12591]AET15839.1 putative tight adherance operon protein [Pasteurella multocida 36950]AIN48017.1 SAF domain protein [Pasteurella multocida]ANJ90092.1 putative tight adherance operon protein [Pasteurella multocida subsp. multocida HB01]AON57588.1 flp operon protein C [Pasteurella multocida]